MKLPRPTAVPCSCIRCGAGLPANLSGPGNHCSPVGDQALQPLHYLVGVGGGQALQPLHYLVGVAGGAGAGQPLQPGGGPALQPLRYLVGVGGGKVNLDCSRSRPSVVF